MKNKILMGLGAISAIALPIAVISCSCSSKSKQEETKKVDEGSGENTNKVGGEKVEMYKADKADYDYNDAFVNITLSEKDTDEIYKSFSTLKEEAKATIEANLIGRRLNAENPSFAYFIYYNIDVQANDPSNKLPFIRYAGTEIRNRRYKITIGLRKEFLPEAVVGQTIIDKLKDTFNSKIVDNKIEEYKYVFDDIYQNMKTIWNIIKSALTAK